MRRIRLDIAYDGTNYHGWQYQEGQSTIEGELRRALSELLPGEEVGLTGASRTDAGVHARQNTACFDTKSRIPGVNFSMALNCRLPVDIRILRSIEAEEDFHPRFSPHKKVYEYRIDRSRIPDPLKRLYCFSFSFPLSLSEMRLAAKELVGEHDFRSFANPDSQVLMHGGDAVRTLYELSLREEGEELILHFEGSGFLYHMIRILTGTLLEIGSGRRRAAEIPEILAAGDRRRAGFTAPAKGLCLLALCYEGDSPLPEGNLSGAERK